MKKLKAIGIVRRIDNLGRVVIPKELRKELGLREKDPLEIFVDDDGAIIFKKYPQLLRLQNKALQYAGALREVLGLHTLICDMDKVICEIGPKSKKFENRSISEELRMLIDQRRDGHIRSANSVIPIVESEDDVDYLYSHQIIAPILDDSVVVGSIIALSPHERKPPTKEQLAVVKFAAGLIQKELEL